MSEHDRVRPYHARDTTTGQEAADAVADVIRHAAERDRAAKKRTTPKGQPKWMLPVSVNLAVLAVYLLIAPPDWVVLDPIRTAPVEEQVDDFRTAMYFQGIVRIEGYLARNGRLPRTLQEAGSMLEGVDYAVRGDSAYVLIGSVGEEVLSYDSSAQSAEAFAGDLSSKVSG